MFEYKINATGKSLGRVASEAAKALIGKTSAEYTPRIPSRVRVTIEHAAKIFMTERRKRDINTRYSGYPSGLKRETLGALVGRRGIEEALRIAVKGMLPRNRLLVGRMKKLIVSE
ncbi:hypothetical protein A2673_00990 [Candidatus Kaiserbacteria bacterium RIFCSPHIGHO2_01_FULL_50_13]|uniref:50S ribosomal protein L13 n=1 Tax=Candidatus Kaiserbacteria bacterium RIFCSPLOWO2_01_FULL_50_24 TaxID=1798507 RepID=A0A1F6EMT7_9BACT|nr:MAG: hypothetical protein A2673_00990 [Candidatus Kaiserbacteria bacterium RIFCSPHIGHO2_01_FULL_50_13]OGG74947.1 MAG: hypothetical protein A3A34_03980 [Candidatus Kaiserbacteria bacterium RIFCSPLOWO2_01_FULL_50_24]OGG81749.1 MAG: hypothetical protein A3H74_01055 [Candidatus Kaiserbacteria bacterium RIFCSPLOWO2_02_FULL_51_13]